jgi:hypothetical protein
MKRLLLALVATAAFSVVGAQQALAQPTDSRPHEPTIQSLQTCVQHASAQEILQTRV